MGPLRSFRSSLTYPIAATLVLVTVVPVTFVGLLLSWSNQEHVTAREEQYLTREADSLSKEISLFFQQHRTTLETTALALQTGSRVDVNAADQLLSGIASQRNFLFLQISNRQGQGTFVGSSELTELVGADLVPFVRQAHEAAIAGEDLEQSFVEIPATGQLVSVIGFALKEKNNRVWGSLIGVIDFASISSRLSEAAYGGLLVSVIDSSGRVILTSEPRMRDKDPSDSPLIRDFLRSPLALTRVYRHAGDQDTGDVLGSVAPIEWAGWGVVLERPVAEAFRIVKDMQIRTLISSGIAAVLALCIGAVLGRALIRRVQTLTDVTTEISEGNFEVRAEITGLDEISQLANNFNTMAGSIEALVRRLRHALRQNQELFLETIRTLATAIDAKDPYTRGHSERVSSYSLAIARHLELNQDEVFRIRIAAILHDVGKLGIRDGILNKPGGLTDEEYSIMKSHAEIGAQIMAPIRMLKDIIPGIRNHHETWDGNGYPDGLSGDGIPLVARIIGVSDTFDAMTTTRPYQKAMSLEFVMQKMREMSGTRFDPIVVKAFDAAVLTGDITPPKRTNPAPTEEAS
ncbi:MAG: HD domain-containing protein [bacterium]|nr:HD domain-containing protein [bacterium]